ncbi:uncharacterized protein LOC62_01G001341 [Vanrija pseudolonga]|uniref:Uncharacterized protein n=1 Tax=Vanrija pseudolonga TaxID=143232 RepID=A0AAF0Y0J5_9TREE|nr:hypothetical protein LOC62_01G001341 [Vanrija pseudolonga]
MTWEPIVGQRLPGSHDVGAERPGAAALLDGSGGSTLDRCSGRKASSSSEGEEGGAEHVALGEPPAVVVPGDPESTGHIHHQQHSASSSLGEARRGEGRATTRARAPARRARTVVAWSRERVPDDVLYALYACLRRGRPSHHWLPSFCEEKTVLVNQRDYIHSLLHIPPIEPTTRSEIFGASDAATYFRRQGLGTHRCYGLPRPLHVVHHRISPAAA